MQKNWISYILLGFAGILISVNLIIIGRGIVNSIRISCKKKYKQKKKTPKKEAPLKMPQRTTHLDEILEMEEISELDSEVFDANQILP